MFAPPYILSEALHICVIDPGGAIALASRLRVSV